MLKCLILIREKTVWWITHICIQSSASMRLGRANWTPWLERLPTYNQLSVTVRKPSSGWDDHNTSNIFNLQITLCELSVDLIIYPGHPPIDNKLNSITWPSDALAVTFHSAEVFNPYFYEQGLKLIKSNHSTLRLKRVFHLSNLKISHSTAIIQTSRSKFQRNWKRLTIGEQLNILEL